VPEASVLRIPPGVRVDTPLCRLSHDLAALAGWRRYCLALALGIILAGALPPVDLTPLLFVAFPGLLWLDEGSRSCRAAFGLGYVFGIGYFLAGMYWIAGALLVDIDAFWWLLPLAALGIPAILALSTGAALVIAHYGARRLAPDGTARIFLFAVAWSGAEWLRGHLLTGLPWNLIGYAWSGGFPGAIAMLQSVAWYGIYGLSLVTVLAASLPALFGVSSLTVPPRTRHWIPGLLPGLLAAGLILVPAAAGALRLHASRTVATGTWLRLVQPSIPETLKWDPTRSAANFRRLIELSAAPSEHPLAAVLWPEAAVPFLLQRDAEHRAALAAIAPKNGYVITGALRANPPPDPPVRIWNSIEAIDAGGDILSHYDKAHLVPFGEYVPFRALLPFKKITAGTIDLSAGPGPQSIRLPHLPPFAPLICYEAIFPGAVVAAGERPAWLLNVTNDAWYGRSSGPFQHFAIARTRAVEEGLPLVRVGNNGISGIIDPMGRVLARVNLDTVGYADVNLPAAGGLTLYARFHDGVFAILLLIAAIPITVGLRRPRPAPTA